MAATSTPRQGGAFRVTKRDDHIALVTLDLPGESVNILRRELLTEAASLFDELEGDPAIRGVILRSGKVHSFIAGADVRMLAACSDANEATQIAEAGQSFLNRLENFPVPVVAAVHGTCLGGGLELALACRGRVATDDPRTVFGLPEVQLGLLPGSGGTQRLPRIAGLASALDMMLSGRQVRADRARRLGLVDDVVPAAILEQAAVALIHSVARRRSSRRRRSWTELLLETTPPGRRLICNRARRRVAERTRGNYPAPLRIIDCVETGLREGFRAGLADEARSFGELAMTAEARQLMGIYFATTAMKKDPGTDADAHPLEVSRTAVLGAGLMGAGISFVTTSRAGLPVRLKDVTVDSLATGMETIHRHLQERVRRGSLTSFEAGVHMRRVTATTGYSGFARRDIVFEAVFEDLELKHRIIREVESACGPKTIIASNTSSIPINDIADGARHPRNVIGMHYFSPVERMPLLEIIATDRTSPDVIATAVDLGRRQGKTVIVVRDGPGFYVNRILAPYLNEALHLLYEGVAIDRIDDALVQFGFPVGPFALLDDVGLDVTAKVAPILHRAFGERMRPTAAADRMLEDGRRGRKSGKGFYRYRGRTGKSGKREVDDGVYPLLDVTPGRSADDREVADRAVLLMINEAAHCQDEGVIRRLRDGDIGAVFGIGFPPFLGGPFRYMDSRGIGNIVERLQELRRQHGERFAPARILTEMAAHDRPFHPEPP